MLNYSTYLPEQQKQYISSILAKKKLGNAYIIHGDHSALLHALAYYFVSIQHCSGKTKPCTLCKNCQRNINIDHIDLFHCKPDKSIGIEQIRHLCNAVQYGPSENPTLFVIIHYADQMTTEAANSFLKILEEPPQNVCFILLTYNVYALLPTIQSRCQFINMTAATPKQLLSFIVDTSDTVIPEKLHSCYSQSLSILSFYLHKKALPEEDIISLHTLQSMNWTERITFTQNLSKQKPWVELQYLYWLEELKVSLKSNYQAVITNINLIIEKLQKLQYNVNVRLQLEDLLIHLVRP